MARRQIWQDEYWLLVMQLYLRKPVGVKPMYSREAVFLSLELHVPPEELFARQCDVANLETPRVERIWEEFGRNPKRLSRAIQLLRSMIGFNSGGDFYDGVDVEESFERDFRSLDGEKQLMPISLVIILDLYFKLTPQTMVKETPEVKDLASMMKVSTQLIVHVLDIFQHCDPYLHRKDVIISPLLQPCQDIWRRYGNIDLKKLAMYVDQLKAYYK